jgi:hypothetical protein
MEFRGTFVAHTQVHLALLPPLGRLPPKLPPPPPQQQQQHVLLLVQPLLDQLHPCPLTR